jgi:NADPH:quinone reductase-like Zn-dependent oxidoreductase
VHAAVFYEHGDSGVLRWEEFPDPIPASDEVVVEVHACGVNRSDLRTRAGVTRWRPPLPHAPGAEFAGRIVAIGSDVQGYEPGQPVTAHQQFACGRCRQCARWRGDLCERFLIYGSDIWGGYAERVRVPERALIPLRDDGDFIVSAAAQCVISTAWHMVVTLGAVRPGETVLVPSASGGVGTAAVQCAKLAGARVLATVGAAAKRDPVRALGADEVIDYSVDSVTDAVHELTGGAGVDAVIDTVGGAQFSEHLASMRLDGRLVTCGAHTGEVVALDVIALFQHGHRILGFRLASPEEIELSIDLALNGVIRVPVAATIALRDARHAHDLLDRREHVGKVVLVRDG